MQSKRGPPNYSHTNAMGGSTCRTSNISLSSLATMSSSSSCSSSSSSSVLSLKRELSDLSLNSNCSKNKLLEIGTGNNKKPMQYYQHSHAHSHAHHHHSYHHHSNSGAANSGNSRIMSSSTGKRTRKHNWGTRERTGMSFLIVIAFFAVFGLIILTELFMIDERSHSAMVMLHHGGGYGGRMGDSMPDYDNVKEDYDLLDGSLLGDNKLGFVEFRDNKLKIQDADNNDAGRLAGVLLNSGGINGYGMGAGSLGMGIGGGGAGGGGGFNVPQIPWGKILPAKIEETLPPYPVGMVPTAGSWQVVNGTRFKFFVFSAYYDRRDGAKLVRVIGATRTRGPERVWCRFWHLNRNISSSANGAGRRQRELFTSSTVMARVKIIRENWNLKYSACFILCPVRGPELDVPYYVSIVSRLRAPPGNLLTLRNTDWDKDFAVANGNQSASNISAATSMSAATLPSPIPTGDRIPDKIAVCVKPFHFNYDQALYLMEYLEFYALLGVSHFTFYNHTLGPHASCVLQHYIDGDVPDLLTTRDVEMPSHLGNSNPTVNSKSNMNDSSSTFLHQNKPTNLPSYAQHYVKPTVNILPWNLRMRSQKEIRTEGLFAAFNDCLYRNMYRYKYLALVDLDEFIVPRHNDTLNDLISSLNRRFRNRNIGAYSFQNAFFYLQFPDDSLVYQNSANGPSTRMRAALVTQRKTKRRYKLHPQKQRSKYICKPEAVIEAGNHFVWEFSPGKGSLNVAPTEAILQHYRVCEFGGNDCIKAPSITDRTATRYVNRLVQRVESVYKYLKSRCDLPELPNLPNQASQTNDNEEGPTSQQVPEKSEKKLNEKEIKLSPTTLRNVNATTKTVVIKIAANTTITMAKTNTTNTAKTRTKAKTMNNRISLKSGENAVPINAVQINESLTKQSNFSRKRKVVVFEEDDKGVPHAIVKYA